MIVRFSVEQIFLLLGKTYLILLKTKLKIQNYHLAAINGGYTSWSAWSSCSYSCGYGKRLRYRTCTNPSAVRGGLTCLQQNLGLSEEEDSCNEGSCPGNVVN